MLAIAPILILLPKRVFAHSKADRLRLYDAIVYMVLVNLHKFSVRQTNQVPLLLLLVVLGLAAAVVARVWVSAL
jgi:hypothetical protein